jgi:hypothetical protein
MNARNWMLVPGLALVAVGCADSITAPEAPLAPADAAFSSHTWQAGQGNAYHNYLAPDVDWSVAGNSVEVCADWTDHATIAAFLEGRGTTADDIEDYKYAVTLLGEEESHEAEIVVHDFSESTGGCVTLHGVADGEYALTVKGKVQVKFGSPPNLETTNHHTAEWEGTVVVGGSFSFRVWFVDDNGNRFSDFVITNNGIWNLPFVVETSTSGPAGYADVTSCSAYPLGDIGFVAFEDAPSDAEETGSFTGAYCDDSTGVAVFEGRLGVQGGKGPWSDSDAATGSFQFEIDGVNQENELTFDWTRPGNPNGNGPSVQGQWGR